MWIPICKQCRSSDQDSFNLNCAIVMDPSFISSFLSPVSVLEVSKVWFNISQHLVLRVTSTPLTCLAHKKVAAFFFPHQCDIIEGCVQCRIQEHLLHVLGKFFTACVLPMILEYENLYLDLCYDNRLLISSKFVNGNWYLKWIWTCGSRTLHCFLSVLQRTS